MNKYSSNHILREIKISKLTDAPMGDDATKTVKFWGELWDNMKVRVDQTKGEIKCWKDGYDFYYFLQNNKNDYLWCDYDKVWAFFEENLVLGYNDTQEFIQTMVDGTLNCGTNIPRCRSFHKNITEDDTLNCVINIPSMYQFKKVDETLK